MVNEKVQLLYTSHMIGNVCVLPIGSPTKAPKSWDVSQLLQCLRKASAEVAFQDQNFPDFLKILLAKFGSLSTNATSTVSCSLGQIKRLQYRQSLLIYARTIYCYHFISRYFDMIYSGLRQHSKERVNLGRN